MRRRNMAHEKFGGEQGSPPDRGLERTVQSIRKAGQCTLAIDCVIEIPAEAPTALAEIELPTPPEMEELSPPPVETSVAVMFPVLTAVIEPTWMLLAVSVFRLETLPPGGVIVVELVLTIWLMLATLEAPVADAPMLLPTPPLIDMACPIPLLLLKLAVAVTGPLLNDDSDATFTVLVASEAGRVVDCGIRLLNTWVVIDAEAEAPTACAEIELPTLLLLKLPGAPAGPIWVMPLATVNVALTLPLLIAATSPDLIVLVVGVWPGAAALVVML